MTTTKIIKVRAREAHRPAALARHRAALVATLAALVAATLSACQSDWRDGIAPAPAAVPAQELAFTATVAPSVTATRADGSLVNRLETALFPTAPREYWAMNAAGELESMEREYYVGVFGYSTGEQRWDKVATPAANFLFNQKMSIGAPDGAVNALTYDGDSLKRFWPNTLYTDADDNEHYGNVSFWAYYPYNPTSANGELGISLLTTDEGLGSGKVLYKMNEDANEQSDFMLSELVADASRSTNPLVGDGSGGLKPQAVALRFHHMLAQVRLYAFVRGADKLVYGRSGEGLYWKVKAKDADAQALTLNDGVKDTTITVGNASYDQYVDKYGLQRTLAVDDNIPDDAPCFATTVWATDPKVGAKSERWLRTETLDVSGRRYRTTATYSMSFNNIYTQATFTPTYDALTGKTTFSSTPTGALGSATVNHYIMNPYWFRFQDGERVMLNDTYMYDYYERTPASLRQDATATDGQDWSAFTLNDPHEFTGADGNTYKNYMSYQINEENADPDALRGRQGWHFNYAPGNVILAVPQQLQDNFVPNVAIKATGNKVTYSWNAGTGKFVPTKGAEVTATVTINMLKMNISWESGFIYCYAFLENDLQPGDDKVRGPESITVVFDPDHQTNQW